MKRKIIILTITLFLSFTAKGQKFFFIGEKSYACTKPITLQSNTSDVNDLDVILAKDRTKSLIIVSSKTGDEVLIIGKLIIYLDDGTVITCIDKGMYDYVDNIASTVYELTNDQLNKMKNSNINTIRYKLERPNGYAGKEGDWSASNIGTSIKTIISIFFTQ